MYDRDTDYVCIAHATIEFAEGRICCGACPLFDEFKQPHCKLSGQTITDPKTVSYRCELGFDNLITVEEAREKRRARLYDAI